MGFELGQEKFLFQGLDEKFHLAPIAVVTIKAPDGL